MQIRFLHSSGKNNAAATRATADVANPLNANDNA